MNRESVGGNKKEAAWAIVGPSAILKRCCVVAQCPKCCKMVFSTSAVLLPNVQNVGPQTVCPYGPNRVQNDSPR